MKLHELVAVASDKSNFTTLQEYSEFCLAWLDFIGDANNLQAQIVARREPHYRFLQFKEDAGFNVTRPLNYNLFYPHAEAKDAIPRFMAIINEVKDSDSPENRVIVNRCVYTMQQCIGSALDALPAGRSNTARKINGDLFERLICKLLIAVGVDCTSGVVRVPVIVDGQDEFAMSYQHDLIVKAGEFVKIIGSVKTSSKDRLDKIFVDKFLLARLTGKTVPHIAIFLNDVQRSGRNPQEYGVSATFLPGHFKGYTLKLNPLDGVYYFDIRPSMQTEAVLRDHIRTFDHFLFDELWGLLQAEAIVAQIEPED